MKQKCRIEKGPFEPTWESLRRYQCPDWFRDAKFGIWSHWGPQSVPMYGYWYARQMYVEGHDQYRYHIRKYGHLHHQRQRKHEVDVGPGGGVSVR